MSSKKAKKIDTSKVTSNRSLNLVIGIALIVSLIVYGVFLYIMYRRGKWIFAPYTPPPLKDGFQPNGKVVKLTPAEQAARRRQLLGSSSTTNTS